MTFNNIWFNIELGINHVLDPNAYDHILFLIALTVPYAFNHWKKLLTLVSLFTLGHTISLILSAYNIVHADTDIVEFLIPVSILIMCVFNILQPGKNLGKISPVSYTHLTLPTIA